MVWRERGRWVAAWVAGVVLAATLVTARARPQAAAAGPLQQAKQLVEWGRLKEARSLLQKTVVDAGNDKNAPLLAYLGHLEVQFGNLKTAADLTKKAVKLDGSCASCHLYRFEVMAKRAQTHNQLRALMALHGIKKQLEEAGQLGPGLGDVQWGWIRFDLALPATVGGSPQAAMEHADQLSRLDAVDGHLARAVVFAAEGQSQQELAEYRQAAAQYPNDPRGVFALGKALYRRADYAGAATPLQRAWKMNPASAFYGAYQAANLIQLRRPRKARAVLGKAAEEHPDSRLGDFLAAQALADTGQNFPWARQLLQRYLTVAPEPGQATAAEARQLLAHLGGATQPGLGPMGGSPGRGANGTKGVIGAGAVAGGSLTGASAGYCQRRR